MRNAQQVEILSDVGTVVVDLVDLLRQHLIIEAVHSLGCTLPNPLMTMSFLALPVIPALKLTDRGLVDVNKFDFVPLFGG